MRHKCLWSQGRRRHSSSLQFQILACSQYLVPCQLRSVYEHSPLTLHGRVPSMCGDYGALACSRRRTCGRSTVTGAMGVIVEPWCIVNIESCKESGQRVSLRIRIARPTYLGGLSRCPRTYPHQMLSHPMLLLSRVVGCSECLCPCRRISSLPFQHLCR